MAKIVHLKHIFNAVLNENSGIMLLSLLPFIMSGMVFDPLNTDAIKDLSNATPYSYNLLCACALFFITLLSLLKSRSNGLMISAMSSVLLCAIALKHEKFILVNQIDWIVLYILYAFTASLTFFAIALVPTFSTRLFRNIIFILLLDMVISVISPSWLLLTPAFFAYFPSHMGIILSIMVLILLRTIWKFYIENAATRKQIKSVTPEFIKTIRRTTLSLWWPMPVIFLLCTLGYQSLQQQYINTPLVIHLNELGVNIPIKVYEQSKATFLSKPSPVPTTVEDASTAAITRITSEQARQIKKRIEKFRAKSGTNKDAVMRGISDSMPKRFPGTKTSSCGISVHCHASNLIKNIINRAYRSARRNMLANIKHKLDRLQRAGNDNAKNIKAAIDESFAIFTSETKRSIGYTAAGMRYLSVAATIYGILILIKSLMIVFARVFYSYISTAPAQTEPSNINDTSNERIYGTMTHLRHQHTLTSDDGYGHYYIDFRTCGNNVIDRRRIPQPLSLLLKRLLSRNYSMCEINLTDNAATASCDIIVDPPSEIVMWDLTDGDEIFIDVRALIGFSSGCTLSSTISLSLGSLIFGRAIYHSITGPGRVFIRTASAPIAGEDEQANNVMQSSSLIAWQRSTRFNVLSSLTRRDIFFSGYSIRTFSRRPHQVIYDTSQQRRVGTGQGIIKMIRSFLMPF